MQDSNNYINLAANKINLFNLNKEWLSPSFLLKFFLNK
jgi:hypothetical protein